MTTGTGQRQRRQPRRQWWLHADEEPSPHPVITLRLLGLEPRWLDWTLTILIVAVLLVSRLLVFPASIWEQDEAYFASAVVDFDPTNNQPHPPWFPLWILLGKAATLVVGDPAAALCWVSLLASVWAVFPITALWSLLLRRRLAAASALLFLLLPGPWLLSARAFTATTASALLALAFAALWQRRPVTGSLAAGACLLVRPHLAVAVVPLVVAAMLRARDPGERLRTVVPIVTLVAGAGAWVAAAAGGPKALIGALRDHAGLHFGQLQDFAYTFADSGLARALVTSSLAALWIGLGAWGTVLVLRSRCRPDAAVPLVACVLLPLAILVFALSNPTHVRYTIPLLACSSGLVVAGAASILRFWVALEATAAVVASCWQVLPVTPQYRRMTSPAIDAVAYAFALAREHGSVVVADRTLVSFIRVETVQRPFSGTVLWAYQIEQGETAPPPHWATVFVFDASHDAILATARARRTFSCDTPLLRRLGQDRFLDVTVAEGAELGATR